MILAKSYTCWSGIPVSWKLSTLNKSDILIVILFNLWIEASKFNILETLDFDSPVEGVIPSDFDYDGQLDFLVISSDSGRTKAYLELFIRKTTSPYFGKQ